MEKPKFKRRVRNYLINPRYQLKYTFLLLGSASLGALLPCALFYLYMQQMFSALITHAQMPESIRAELAAQVDRVIRDLLPYVFVFLGLVVAVAIVITHRTAGPMFHFRRVFAAIRGGALDARIHLRKYDDFKEVADEFNLMMDSLAGSAARRSKDGSA